MNDDINLVQGQSQQKKVEHTLFEFSVGVFAFFAIIAVVLLIISLFLTITSSNLENQTGNLRSELSNLPNKQKLLIVKERLSQIRTILSHGNGVEESVSKIVAIIPESFSLESVSADDKKISITISGGSLLDFATLLSTTLPDFIAKNKKSITSVEIENFSENGGGYSLSITFNLAASIK